MREKVRERKPQLSLRKRESTPVELDGERGRERVQLRREGENSQLR